MSTATQTPREEAADLTVEAANIANFKRLFESVRIPTQFTERDLLGLIPSHHLNRVSDMDAAQFLQLLITSSTVRETIGTTLSSDIITRVNSARNRFVEMFIIQQKTKDMVAHINAHGVIHD